MKKTKQFRPTAFILNAKMKVSLMLLLMLMLVPQGAWALGGSGTSSSPYTIANASDLVAFASKVNGSEQGAYAKLTADITLTSAWTAMGTSSKIYTGTFDGQGHKISGLSLTATADNAGFFGYVNNATIQNFTLEGTVSSNSDNVGSVVGTANGATKIYNVYSSVNITMTAAKSHIGGIVGQILQAEGKTGEIKGCTYSGTMNLGSSTDSNGGIVGYCGLNANIEIENCFFSGSISSTGSNPCIGGILGYADDDGSTQNFKYIRNCFCDGTLSPSTGNYVGIFAGYPRGKVKDVISNNTYVSTASTNMAGNSTQTTAANNGCKKITISVTAGTTGGSVSQSYVNPTSTTATKLHVEAAPKTGYHFTKWSDNNTTADRNDVSLSANVSLTANFAAHTYGDAVWTWATDGKSASAKITCTVCGNELSGNAAITSKVKKASTCTAKGTTTYTAKVTLNGTEYTDTKDVVDINMLNHSMTTHAATDATCTTKGNYLYYTCSQSCCSGKYYKDNAAHTTNAYANQAATEKAMLSHSMTTHAATDATCTATGNYLYYTCSQSCCSDKYYKDNGAHTTNAFANQAATVIAALGHSMTEHAHVAATCTTTGNEAYWTCSRSCCSGKYYKDVNGAEQWSQLPTINELPHTYTETVAPEYLKSAATCTKPAMYYRSCSVCHASENSSANAFGDGDPLGHTVVDGACTVCGSTGDVKVVLADGILTFYKDLIRHEGKIFELNEGTKRPAWAPDSLSITKVVFDASFASVRPTTCYYWFCKFRNMTSIEGMQYLNTEEATEFVNMFRNCESIESIDLSHFNTEKVTRMAAMFYGCTSLQTIDVSTFNTENVSRMEGMFEKCSSLQSIDLRNFNTEKVTSMEGMFASCTSLTALDLSSFNCRSSLNCFEMFMGCSSLETLSIGNIVYVDYSNTYSSEGYSLHMFDGCDKLTTLNIKSIPSMTKHPDFKNHPWTTVNYLLDDNSYIDVYGYDYQMPAATSVHYTRALEVGKTVTFILPFDTNVDNINGKVYELTDFDGEVLTFSEPVDGIVHAHKPYLLRETAEGNLMKAPIGSYTFDIPGWAWFDTNVGEASMSGTYRTHKNLYSTEEESIYGYSHGELVRQLSKEEGATQGATIKPFRALFRVKEPDGASNAKARLALAFGEETSGVISIDNDDLNNKPVNVYDLNGRIVRANVNPITCLQGLPKGIYIVDGQRIMKRGEAQQGVSKATDAAASPATRSAAAEQMSVDGVIYN